MREFQCKKKHFPSQASSKENPQIEDNFNPRNLHFIGEIAFLLGEEQRRHLFSSGCFPNAMDMSATALMNGGATTGTPGEPPGSSRWYQDPPGGDGSPMMSDGSGQGGTPSAAETPTGDLDSAGQQGNGAGHEIFFPPLDGTSVTVTNRARYHATQQAMQAYGAAASSYGELEDLLPEVEYNLRRGKIPTFFSKYPSYTVFQGPWLY